MLKGTLLKPTFAARESVKHYTKTILKLLDLKRENLIVKSIRMKLKPRMNISSTTCVMRRENAELILKMSLKYRRAQSVMIAGESTEQEQNDEHQKALEQVVRTGSAANEQEEDKDPAAHTNQSSGGARGEGLETIEHNVTITVEDIPVQEPATMNENIVQGHEPTVGSSREADREVSFKPAEISTLYESFDEDEDYGTDEKADFSATDVRMAALLGQNEKLKRYLQLKPQYVSERDDNGWQLIHEAAKAGQVDTMKLLLTDYGADINARAGLVNDGATPLYLAYKYGHDDSSKVVSFIKAHGGVSVAPGHNAPYKTAAQHTAEELEQYTS